MWKRPEIVPLQTQAIAIRSTLIATSNPRSPNQSDKMKTLLLFCSLGVATWGQAQSGTTATSTGKCSVANSGSNNTFTINCGIGKAEGDALLKIMNKILRNQLELLNSIPRSRVMKPEKLGEFMSALCTTHGIIRVVPATSAEDAFRLEQQICAAAQHCKWAYGCPNGRNAEIDNVDIEGLRCYSDNWNTKKAIALKSAMRAGGLECEYIPHRYDFHGGLGTAGETVVVGGHSQ